jgi:hypothetical protein
MATNPGDYGFTNIFDSAQGQDVDPDTYLFWDDLHPTTAGHYQIAFAANALLGTIWYGPVYGTAQSIVPPHMRATTAAILLFIINLIGLGLGPLAVGLLSEAGDLDSRIWTKYMSTRCKRSLWATTPKPHADWIRAEIEEAKANPLLVIKHFVPPRPLITREQFDAIRRYYLEQAAIQYQKPAPTPKPPISPLFDPLPFAISPSVITMAGIDPSDQTLLIGSSRPPGLLVLERGRTTRIEVHSEPVTFERIGPLRRVALMGHFGRDYRLGRIVDFDLRDGIQQTLVDGHPRIAAHRTADVPAPSRRPRRDGG